MGCDGCELRVPGSETNHCYAADLVRRWAGSKGYPKSFDKPELFAGRIEAACRWRDLTGTTRPDKPWLNGMPRLIFMNDLSDPFSPSVDSEAWLTPALPAIASSPHIWLLLTKRPTVALSYWRAHAIPRNVWPGVSITGPASLRRIDYLAQMDAPVRFVSIEPLIDRVDVAEGLRCCPDCLKPPREECGGSMHGGLRRVDWVILGGESGSNARPMQPEWAQSVRDQCVASNVPFFFKQWGEWLPGDQDGAVTAQGQALNCANEPIRLGKHAAGRLLDGRQWNEMPEVRS